MSEQNEFQKQKHHNEMMRIKERLDKGHEYWSANCIDDSLTRRSRNQTGSNIELRL